MADIYRHPDKDYWEVEDLGWETWQFPDGPWGWDDNGQSKAPTSELRRHHLCWFHDQKDTLDLIGSIDDSVSQHPSNPKPSLADWNFTIL